MERRADWPGAEVEATDEGFVLRVPIEGEPDPDWDDAFRRTVERRRQEVWTGHWGHIRHRPDQVSVEQVSEGSEKDLQEFLDACIHEAGESMRQEELDRQRDEAALVEQRTEASYAPDPTHGAQRADAERMTRRFRER